MFRYMKNEKIINGSTGDVSFDNAGDRLNPTYDVINVISRRRKFNKVGTYKGNKVRGSIIVRGSSFVGGVQEAPMLVYSIIK